MKLGIRLDVGWVGLGWRGGAITESLEDVLKAAFFLWLRMRHGSSLQRIAHRSVFLKKRDERLEFSYQGTNMTIYKRDASKGLFYDVEVVVALVEESASDVGSARIDGGVHHERDDSSKLHGPESVDIAQIASGDACHVAVTWKLGECGESASALRVVRDDQDPPSIRLTGHDLERRLRRSKRVPSAFVAQGAEESSGRCRHVPATRQDVDGGVCVRERGVSNVHALESFHECLVRCMRRDHRCEFVRSGRDVRLRPSVVGAPPRRLGDPFVPITWRHPSELARVIQRGGARPTEPLRSEMVVVILHALRVLEHLDHGEAPGQDGVVHCRERVYLTESHEAVPYVSRAHDRLREQLLLQNVHGRLGERVRRAPRDDGLVEVRDRNLHGVDIDVLV